MRGEVEFHWNSETPADGAGELASCVLVPDGIVSACGPGTLGSLHQLSQHPGSMSQPGSYQSPPTAGGTSPVYVNIHLGANKLCLLCICREM